MKTGNLDRSEKIHLGLAIFWIIMTVPTLMFWKESVAVVLVYSVYALVGAHISAFQAAGATKVDEKTREQLNHIIKLLEEK